MAEDVDKCDGEFVFTSIITDRSSVILISLVQKGILGILPTTTIIIHNIY